MLPKAVDNVNTAKEIEVLLEAVEEQRLHVREAQRVLALAEEEHRRLVQENDGLLAAAKHREDTHTRLLKQHHYAGVIDAETQDTLLVLEGRRQTLQRCVMSLQHEVSETNKEFHQKGGTSQQQQREEGRGAPQQERATPLQHLRGQQPHHHKGHTPTPTVKAAHEKKS
eukprot:CAMPEP_0176464748 /NCGR_PEP_ID=MMETSP0127-20121128/36748_1 /TAXON_ID=938130 /ORGANISM="Platyophrya macrostoma, Strain WH" /LENGTH=168 /DNA_ID=CAMNT_0017857317 /DNA_START=171 /DNA_END=674 /DNA_ORIENTATION=-